MVFLKNEEEIVKIKKACRVAALVLDKMCNAVCEGVSTYELDEIGQKEMNLHGAKSASYNYKIGDKTFPSHSCISVNEELVHGIPSIKKILKNGDVVSIDVALSCDGYFGDNARTVCVGDSSDSKIEKLLSVTQESLFKGIDKAVAGNRVGDISNAVQSFVEKNGFSVVREFVGHGVGRFLHEEPQVPNFGKAGKGILLKEGMTLAIEPMVNLGKSSVEVKTDGWTVVTKDKKTCAHFEHSILITKNKAEVLTFL